MIILELTRGVITELAYGQDAGGIVSFHGRQFAQGFTLAMPTREWAALGNPKTIQFVVSAKKLTVAGDKVCER